MKAELIDFEVFLYLLRKFMNQSYKYVESIIINVYCRPRMKCERIFTKYFKNFTVILLMNDIDIYNLTLRQILKALL